MSCFSGCCDCLLFYLFFCSGFFLSVQPEHQQLIVDAGALPYLVSMLKRRSDGSSLRAISSVIRRAADAITNLSHENSSIKTCVRLGCVLFSFNITCVP